MAITYALVSEGKSDRMLLDPINWLLSQHCSVGFSGLWANPAVMDDRSRVMQVRLSQVNLYFPCDVAFVHRDVDRETLQDRVQEIEAGAAASGFPAPIVCVVPVRMTESWFLFSEEAIRKAAGNPTSRVPLQLPNHAAAERVADTKALLEQKLIVASELSGRKLKQFRGEIAYRKALVSSHIGDFAPLRNQDSFRIFESKLLTALRTGGWA